MDADCIEFFDKLLKEEIIHRKERLHTVPSSVTTRSYNRILRVLRSSSIEISLYHNTTVKNDGRSLVRIAIKSIGDIESELVSIITENCPSLKSIGDERIQLGHGVLRETTLLLELLDVCG